jgi:histidinol dehydrogenase
VAVVSDSEGLLRNVNLCLTARIRKAGRRPILKKSLPAGLSVLAASAAAAVDAVNLLRPEHLEIHTRDPRSTFEKIRGAGAVFLGPGTPTALGDYGIGPNHTLPTGRTARFASALSAMHFVRVTSVIEAEPGPAPLFAAPAALLARAEGLLGHAQSLEELESGPKARAKGKRRSG